MTDTERNGRLLSQLLATKYHLLLRQARKHAQLEADVPEAFQSACLLFLERYRPDLEPLPWLLTTIKREAWGLAKRASRRRELGITAVPRRDGLGTIDLSDALLDEDADPADAAEASQLRDRRREAIVQLKPDQRTALLFLGLGCSYAEIAELRGWTMTKVNRCITEGRAALRSGVASQ